MKLHSRDISTMLRRYAALVSAEHMRRMTLDDIMSGEESTMRLDEEAQAAQEASNYLWDLKEYL